MNINTERVRKRGFNGVIKSELKKKSQEYRVLATLRYFYREIFEDFVPAESPDLQNSILSVGIEVTTAVYPEDMKATVAFSDLRRKDNLKAKNRFSQTGYNLKKLGSVCVLESPLGTANDEKCFFQRAIRKKHNKLNVYRNMFKKVGLAIILEEIPSSEFECDCVKWLKEVCSNINDPHFDFYIVLSYRFIVLYQIESDKEEKQIISTDENRSLLTIGRMTAEGDLSLSDVEWQKQNR